MNDDEQSRSTKIPSGILLKRSGKRTVSGSVEKFIFQSGNGRGVKQNRIIYEMVNHSNGTCLADAEHQNL